ncbi:HD domain-containing protein [Caulobacter soli]|uniref:HD domain-containing protein n=1 Tax=Caulobacter soli TaxID=2708539 RepID=UPI0013E9CC58|nr:HD domain-containing protein [Caulobacter soli]
MDDVIGFILELDKLKGVTRKVKPLGLDRYENPAEHSWQIALAAAALQPYAAQPVDLPRVVSLLLVHDVGEIDTGDVMAFVETGLSERKAAERRAVERIFGVLPETQAQALVALWDEFEDEETPEARFAHAIDRAMPVLLNLANNGQSWRENGISHERVVARVAEPIRRGCPRLWTHIEARLAVARQEGLFGA